MTEREMIIAIAWDLGLRWARSESEDKSLLRVLKKYPTDLNAAIKLCDALAKERWLCTMTIYGPSACRFEKGKIAHEATSLLLATAICIAYCKVKGIWSPAALQPCTSEPGSGRYD